MNSENIQFKKKFADITGMFAANLSLNPTIGQIYGLLYMSKNSVSLNEMVKILGISKGAVSTNVRILESWGAVKKVWVGNTRQDFYEANPETLKIIFSRMRDGLTKRINDAQRSFKELKTGFEKDHSELNNEDSQFIKKRINRIKDMYESINDLLVLFEQNSKSDNE